MTIRTAATRRILAAASAVAAIALLGAAVPTASAEAPTAPQSAHVKTTTSKVPAQVKAAQALQATKTAEAQAARAAAIAADYSSIFAGQLDAYVGAGWATCAAPIAWTVDTEGLSAGQAADQVANLQDAFDAWAATSGLVFAYAGTQDLTYNDEAFSLTPADGSPAADRHIYLSFVADSSSDRLGGGIVGLGSPSMVWQSSKEIVAGAAVFRTDHVLRASDAEDTSLYTHEIGHVLGLAHAHDAANVMYAVVTDHTALGAGDANGVRSMLKPCDAGA